MLGTISVFHACVCVCACTALTASTVGMGDCQAAVKYTQGSFSGSSSALSKPGVRFSDKRGF